MPHTIMALLDGTAHSALCFQRWAEFCRIVVDDPVSVETSGTIIQVQTLRSTSIYMEKLTQITVEDALGMMHAQKATRRVWTGAQITKPHL